jgi:hypothetical protein
VDLDHAGHFERDQIQFIPSVSCAIRDWSGFPWHRDQYNVVQAHKIRSSQALAIDVFGTIKASSERDRILTALAERCGLPADGPWDLELEWTDPDGLLGEPRPTQVDAVAFGKAAIIVIECKFTESGGTCSQPIPIRKGPHRGQRQCTGDYRRQTNPISGATARCALTAKGIRYWDSIPGIFGVDSTAEYRPCPFKGDAYQWMRNVVLVDTLATARGVAGVVLAAYADGDNLPTAIKARRGELGHAAASGARLVIPVSYQAIVALAKSVARDQTEWDKRD